MKVDINIIDVRSDYRSVGSGHRDIGSGHRNVGSGHRNVGSGHRNVDEGSSERCGGVIVTLMKDPHIVVEGSSERR